LISRYKNIINEEKTMFIQVGNLPCGTTIDDIYDLFCSMSIIDSIHVCDSDAPEHVVAWVKLHCSQTGANAISDVLDGKFFKGRHVSTYAGLFLH
jgi:hypothetical protein